MNWTFPAPAGLIVSGGAGRAPSPDPWLTPGATLSREGERATHPRLAASIAATSIFRMVSIASKARFASAPPAAIASVSTRGVICQETPHRSLHQPHAL